jgi:RNA polymerase sigma factor (sigma-70 family)
MMQLLRPSKDLEQTLERMFTAKYPWLLRWALHFAQNDPAAAEDLVQETFVRILVLKDALGDVDNIEPLLYTHLRYAYLTERRRGRSHSFQSLAAVDFDTLSISLRTTATFDQIEVQNELRKILVFLLWRKRAAKFANIFLLRFFHEFNHQEIAGICLVSRHAVDLALARAREELKAYVAGTQQIRVMGRGYAPEFKPHNTAVPSDKFANDMMLEIFQSAGGPCPSDDRLEQRYRAFTLRPLENDLLAHLVGCRTCLDRIAKIFQSSPPSPPQQPSLESIRRSTKITALTQSERAVTRSEKISLARIFDHGKRRMRETFDHYPSDLVIALNAEIVAARDISSSRAVLKVETRSDTQLELIEIFSEQGILLLILPVTEHLPESPPELWQEVRLSNDRTLTLCVRFTGEGAHIEATYLDPHSAADANESRALEILQEDDIGIDNMSAVKPPEVPPSGDVRSVRRPSRWWSFLKNVWSAVSRRGALIPVAVPVLIAAVVAWIIFHHSKERIDAGSLLRDTMRSEVRLRAAFGPGVVHQQVEIRAFGRAHRRDIYRDLDGRRSPKSQPLDSDDQILRAKLAEAQYDWQDPLSAANFEAWRDRIPRQREDIERSGNDLLTVTTTASSGPVMRQSITIRLGDLHPVARSLLFRDREGIQVAELSYEVVSWGPASEGWFANSAENLLQACPLRSAPPLPVHSSQVSEDQLDLAELGVLLALQELHADTERLQPSRTSSGIVVTGIVESDSRKLEISSRLKTIAHVSSTIWSYRDLETKSGQNPEGMNITAMSVTAEDSPLDKYCEGRHLARDRCRQSAHQILSASANLVLQSKRLRDLARQFPSSKALTPEAQVPLNELIALYIRHLAVAAGEEEEAFPVLELESSSGISLPESPAPELRDLAEHNLRLATELVYASNGHARDASLILRELATSARDIHAAVSRISNSTTIHTEVSPIFPTPHHE